MTSQVTGSPGAPAGKSAQRPASPAPHRGGPSKTAKPSAERLPGALCSGTVHRCIDHRRADSDVDFVAYTGHPHVLKSPQADDTRGNLKASQRPHGEASCRGRSGPAGSQQARLTSPGRPEALARVQADERLVSCVAPTRAEGAGGNRHPSRSGEFTRGQRCPKPGATPAHTAVPHPLGPVVTALEDELPARLEKVRLAPPAPRGRLALVERPSGERPRGHHRAWYHGGLSRHAAEALLLSNGRDGSYLLRDSHEQAGLYSLSVRAKESVKHFHVEYTGYSFKFGFNEFSSLKDFVKHFANQPLIGSETGTLLVLRHPYPRAVEEPSIYESVRVHTAMQTGRTEHDLVPTAPSLGTKEGYLTKQGGLVKTWKTRWFTLHRNELKYFKDQMSPEPIRILDLTECSAVQFDYSQERVNCFCLVFPFRTFYLCAKTGVEADEWIKILRWKLSQIRKQLDQSEGTIRSQSFIFK
ncbi:dual adapter for phosphotyrosine and 3-phosphotyrosine and 3-phosphoinositide [Talpa occidentalis]|uniref:dual adapter for phosphotyrosine and 3-phosphotyrosine and 3-phosphoinositide n=1 Tax=Talpa occidentalis TaxID=50954 RepID=UPI00188F6DC6|nr:dual adapter for phosphotyrosine and 3-phosphotyrosine and 3-phosphoinositide [Talpa occidentalis]